MILLSDCLICFPRRLCICLGLADEKHDGVADGLARLAGWPASLFGWLSDLFSLCECLFGGVDLAHKKKEELMVRRGLLAGPLVCFAGCPICLSSPACSPLHFWGLAHKERIRFRMVWRDLPAGLLVSLCGCLFYISHCLLACLIACSLEYCVG